MITINETRFAIFAEAVQSRGWEPRRLRVDHWQIRGSLAKPVNFHFDNEGGLTGYVSGCVNGLAIRKELSAMLEFAAGDESVPLSGKKDERIGKNKSRRIRRQLLARKPLCHWCNTGLTAQTATLEHIMPLSRGGSNREDNLTLACNGCNQRRKNSVQSLEVWSVHTVGGTC